MKPAILFSLFIIISLSMQLSVDVLAQAQNPASYFGFQPGSDRKLVDYSAMVNYFQTLEQHSDRLRLVSIGVTPQGRTMYMALISAPENLRNLDHLREINRKLALDPAIPKAEREQMIAEGRIFVLGTLSMHSPEVAPTQAAPLIAWELINTTDPQKLECLRNVVYMMVINHNPDGMEMMVSHYRKSVGTPYEGSSLPGVYHQYIGHDNNRDFISLTQSDTRAVAAIFNLDWFPQVMVEKHQMGPTGVRYFVPPPHDPIAENVDAGIWSWIGVFGSAMMKDMTAAGLKGIAQRYLFDDYWPGPTETCIWKNVIGFLTEAASVHVATPLFIEENELEVHGKGLSEYKKSINMPEPWPGGWWRLSDIIRYEETSTFSILNTASNHRSEILQFRNELCRLEVNKGKTEAPYYFILPTEQHDPVEMVDLVNLLTRQGVNCYVMKDDFTYDNRLLRQGSVVVPLVQPFRAFIKEVMEKQTYPVRHYTPDGEIIKPYDITSWSLPLHRGVRSLEIRNIPDGLDTLLVPVGKPFKITNPLPAGYKAILLPVGRNESFKAAFLALENGLAVSRSDKGDFILLREKGKTAQFDSILSQLSASPVFITTDTVIPSSPVALPRIVLVETRMHDIDAGWTRFVFDSYHIPYRVVHPGEFEKTDFVKDFDVVIFPDNDKSILMEGRYESEGQIYPTSYPPEATKGIGKKGMSRLMDFFEQGGIILSWGSSTELFTGLLSVKKGDTTEEFRLPVRDITKTIVKEGLFCPGSLAQINLIQNHPLTFGMESSAGIFYRGDVVFATSIPRFDMDRRVIGKFPDENILLSGYCEKCEKLADKTAMVWLKKGKGQMVLYGFNPQFRASTQGTYKLLFNALLLQKDKNSKELK
jgi:hypothetical protein